MRARDFLNQLRRDEIAAAIQSAELRTSGEIRVFVSRKPAEDAVAAAEAEFIRLGMAKTELRNGVLIFVAPASHTFAVIGDKAIHERCGQEFWKELSQSLNTHFRQSDFTRGIIQVVGKAGELLARHFPRGANDRNELQDDIAHD